MSTLLRRPPNNAQRVSKHHAHPRLDPSPPLLTHDHHGDHGRNG
jgi:hypothetical protein